MLQENQTAPDFELPLFSGERSRLYYQRAGISVLIFYKLSCPTCQVALPYFQKMYDAYGDVVGIFAVAQEGPEKTRQFREEYGISIPTFMDTAPYPVSTRYGLRTVPSVFLVSPEYKILYAGEGFVKQDLLNLADILAEKSGRPQIDLFGDESVPDIKPG